MIIIIKNLINYILCNAICTHFLLSVSPLSNMCAKVRVSSSASRLLVRTPTSRTHNIHNQIRNIGLPNKTLNLTHTHRGQKSTSVSVVLDEGTTASLPPVLTIFFPEMTAHRTASRVVHVNAFSPALAKHGPVRLEQLKQKVFAAQSEMGEGKLPWELLLYEKAAVDDLFRWHSSLKGEQSTTIARVEEESQKLAT